MVSVLTLDQKVWVRSLAGSLCGVLGQDSLLSLCLSLPTSMTGCRQIVR